MASIGLVSSAFTVAKVVRDNQEDEERYSMLILLFVLAILYTICTAILHTLIKKKNFGMSYSAFSVIQGACMGASVVILLILLLKGRTLV
ncbi:hypothetical protein ACSMFR_11910 [Listeria aquatica]|uniref:hypothetical protein n=1 Tax=Listeria aquatica TaxID=1494960 RepID=UPI003F6F75B4